jgi:hypothetical protein
MLFAILRVTVKYSFYCRNLKPLLLYARTRTHTHTHTHTVHTRFDAGFQNYCGLKCPVPKFHNTSIYLVYRICRKKYIIGFCLKFGSYMFLRKMMAESLTVTF